MQPTLHPPVFVSDIGEEWDPKCTVGGDWYYVNRRDSREVSWDLIPESVGDWKVYWDVSEQEWAWKHVVSGEITMEAPPPLRIEIVDEDVVGRNRSGGVFASSGLARSG